MRMWQVQMLTPEGETELFSGGYHYTIKTVIVPASNKKVAEEAARAFMRKNGSSYTCVYAYGTKEIEKEENYE